MSRRGAKKKNTHTHTRTYMHTHWGLCQISALEMMLSCALASQQPTAEFKVDSRCLQYMLPGSVVSVLSDPPTYPCIFRKERETATLIVGPHFQ